MKIILPLSLRRFLLGSLLFSVTMATASAAAEFVVDAAQTTNPGQHVYATLQELAASGVLAFGDTVILHNDDASLSSGFTAAVNFRSNDPDTFRTIDLSGLGYDKSLYELIKPQGNLTLEIDSIIIKNAGSPITGYETDASSLEINGRLQFMGNGYSRIHTGYGVPLTLGNGVIFSNNIHNMHNQENYYATLIFAGDDVTIGDNATFSDNLNISLDSPLNLSGAIAIQNGSLTIGSKAVFIRNKIISETNQNIFSGAIYCAGDSLTIRDGALFVDNYTGSIHGGTIVSGLITDIRLYALTNDVLFSGNMTQGAVTVHDDGSISVENGIANAILMNNGYRSGITLAAAQGREIRFNDPIVSNEHSTLTLNRRTDEEGNVQDTDGTIIFSGELYQGDEAHLVASRYNRLFANSTLYGGTLLLEHSVIFGVGLDDPVMGGYTSLTVEKGTLEITGGSTANAIAFSLSGRDAVLRPGDSAFINANTADFSRGFTFDMRHQLQAGPDFGPGLTLSAAQSFTAGGLIGVADTGSNAPFFYADRSWKQDRVFHVLTDAEHTLQGNFDGVVSQATGTDRVDSPYSYTGTWSHRWTDADGDGYAEQLQLVWKADGPPISSIDPELAGELAFNSLWSSASNAAALGGNVLSRLSVPRLTDRHARNLWGMGLGDFARQRSRGGVDGYDYNGGGYSVGADSGMGGEDEGIWGIAFGQLYGHARSRDFQGRNTQDTRMGSLYWGRLMEESNRAYWIFKGSLTWAETRNNMTSRLSGAPASTGKWNNETWLAQAEVSRTADCAGGWRLTPFVRMEFTHGRQDAFRELGGYGRDFGGAALKRLSIPVGLEIGRTDEWKGRPWAQSLRVSYVGDVLRDVPEGTVYSPYSDMSWRGRAVSPERHGLRAEYNTSLQCNERWSVYGGYGLEVRGSSCYHRVNAGLSRSF